MQETWVQSLGQEDVLDKEMETHFNNSYLENLMDRGTPSGLAVYPLISFLMEYTRFGKAIVNQPE